MTLMDTLKNALAGVGSSVWSALLSLAFIPFYIQGFGVESFALISLFATLQVIFHLLDMGFSMAFSKEVAHNQATGQNQESQKNMATLEVTFWAMALPIAVLGFLFSPFISSHWLQASTMTTHELASAIFLMACVCACGWPSVIYHGTLIGSQRMGLTSLLNVGSITASHAGAIFIMLFINPSIHAFFMWQAFVAMTSSLVTRHFAWASLGGRNGAVFNASCLKKTWLISSKIGLLAVLSMVLTQMDKIILSKMIPLDEYGKYAISWSLASGLILFGPPLFSAILPKMTSLLAIGNQIELVKLYRNGTRFVCFLLFPISIWGGLHSFEILSIWTSNPDLSQYSAPILSFLILGSTINVVTIFPYALQIASSHVKISLKICLGLILCYLPLLTMLIYSFGVVGAAQAWFALNAINLIFGSFYTHRVLLKSLVSSWILVDVTLPFILSLIMIKAFMLIPLTFSSPLINLIASALFAMTSSLFLLFLFFAGKKNLLMHEP